MKRHINNFLFGIFFTCLWFSYFFIFVNQKQAAAGFFNVFFYEHNNTVDNVYINKILWAKLLKIDIVTLVVSFVSCALFGVYPVAWFRLTFSSINLKLKSCVSKSAGNFAENETQQDI